MLARCVLGALAIVLGIVFQGQNVAFMVGLAFAIAASANFPALVLSMFWRGFTTRGAQASMLVGTVSALLLIYLSPTVQVGVLGRAGSVVSADESWPRHDSAVVLRGHRRLARESRTGGGREASPRSSTACTSGDD